MDPILGTIILFAGNFAPYGWAMCNGQLLAIQQYSALFSVLGTVYGGNGVQNFGLPDLRGRVPMGAGQGAGLPNFEPGQLLGTYQESLSQAHLPAHIHTVSSALKVNDTAGITAVPVAGNSLALVKDINTDAAKAYNTSAPNVTLNAGSIANTVSATGGNEPHNNMQPSLVMNYIIATQGIYPTRP